MILTFAVLIFSIFLIWKGSDWLTDSLIPVAHRLGTSYIAVTTLLASFMMSTPELLISIYSYFLGYPKIGLGVLIGSVMINIGLTVGLSASIKPLRIEKGVAVRDGIFLIFVTMIVMALGSDLRYERSEGVILLLMFIPYALNVWFFEKARPHKRRKKKIESIKQSLDLLGNQFHFAKFKPSIFTFVIGALILLFGSFLFSNALVRLAEVLCLPELMVGLIFGAVGTGIPNIAAAIQGTLKGYDDAAITETFGSNIFTLLVTLGVFTILNPFTILRKVFYFDLIWMIVIHVLMLAFIFKGYKYREESLTRYEGAILVLFYLGIVMVNTLWFA